MYRLLLMAFLGLCYISSHAQSKSTDFLDGKIFSIDNYINGQLDNSEDIIFYEGKMEGTLCTEYGFQGADYQVVKQSKKDLQFECTMYSSLEGKMVWKGTATKNKVEGTCLWTKDGQDAILLTFVGKLKE